MFLVVRRCAHSHRSATDACNKHRPAGRPGARPGAVKDAQTRSNHRRRVESAVACVHPCVPPMKRGAAHQMGAALMPVASGGSAAGSAAGSAGGGSVSAARSGGTTAAGGHPGDGLSGKSSSASVRGLHKQAASASAVEDPLCMIQVAVVGGAGGGQRRQLLPRRCCCCCFWPPTLAVALLAGALVGHWRPAACLGPVCLQQRCEAALPPSPSATPSAALLFAAAVAWRSGLDGARLPAHSSVRSHPQDIEASRGGASGLSTAAADIDPLDEDLDGEAGTALEDGDGGSARGVDRDVEEEEDFSGGVAEAPAAAERTLPAAGVGAPAPSTSDGETIDVEPTRVSRASGRATAPLGAVDNGAGDGGADASCIDDLSSAAFRAELTSAGRLNVWFIRTSRETALGTLDSCAVSSALEHNPRAAVMVMSNSLGCAAARLVHPGLRIVRFSYEDVYRPFPPLLAWYRGGVWKGAYDYNNLGNALRLALLYRFGGVYFDTDMLSLRPLLDSGAGQEAAGPAPTGPAWPPAAVNFIGVERDSVLNNAAIGFSARHPFVELAMRRFVREFKKVWGWNGPALLTRTWHNLQGAFNASFHSRVTIRPQFEFYAIPFSMADDFFAPMAGPRALRWLRYFEGKPPRALHVWNKKLKGKMKGIGKSAPPSGAADGSSGSAGVEDAELVGEAEAAAAFVGAPKPPSFVEYLMRHACPAFLLRMHSSLVASIDALRKAPPVSAVQPSFPNLAKAPLWLSWPAGRPRAVAWGGATSEPPPARRAPALVAGPGTSSGGSSSGGEDDVCGTPAGSVGGTHVACGFSLPLPITNRSSYAWTATVWFKIGGGDGFLAPEDCPALGCQGGSTCDWAPSEDWSVDDPVAALAARRSRGRRKPKLKAYVDAAAVAAPSARVDAGVLSFRVEAGKLRLRFPHGLMQPVTKVNVTSGVWRSLTIAYDCRQRRAPDAGSASAAGLPTRLAAQGVGIYIDGLLVSERHIGSMPLNATLLPATMLLGTRMGGPRVSVGAVTLYGSRLTDLAVLELHNAHVAEALELLQVQQRAGGCAPPPLASGER